MRKVLLIVVAVMALGATSAEAAQVQMCNVAIPMSDGVTLRANITLPAPGVRVPTILTVTGYNKDVANPTGTNCAPGQGISGSDPNMVSAGYAVMTVDDRGTGASGGAWDSWGARTQQDYKEVLDWIQRQPWSDSKVGMYGGSYMGITSLLVAEADAARVAAGKPRAVDAVWADVPMADAYRDVTFHGGAVDSGFIPLWLGLTTALSDIPPSTTPTDPSGSLSIYAQHLANGFSFAGQKILDTTTGGDSAYDGPFYQLRSPVERIASLKIPVAWTGGWWDIFQRGEPLLYERMTGSPDKVWFQTPNYHGAPNATDWAQMGIGTEEQVAIRWFDHWLLGAGNGVQKLPHVNLYTDGSQPLGAPVRLAAAWNELHALLSRPRQERFREQPQRRQPCVACAGDAGRRRRATHAHLEPVLADERAVDRRRREQPAVRHRQPHVRGRFADVHDAAASL